MPKLKELLENIEVSQSFEQDEVVEAARKGDLDFFKTYKN